ncbi:MAG: ParB/RepB/Spo0J family partition protein [Burkholderiaceae bacterium]
MKKRGLGRGLNELLGDSPAVTSSSVKGSLNLSDISVGPYQPRKFMDDDALKELADSIKVQGLIQPIVVREVNSNAKAKYEIIAGERRWRASKMAGLKTVPVVIKNVDDQTAMAMALIENLQRENLNSHEEAEGLARLIEEHNLTHSDAAKLLGKSRAAVSNLLRLLTAPNVIQGLLKKGELEQGHVRAMLGLPLDQQLNLSSRIKENGHSVRWVEKMVKEILKKKTPLTNNSVRTNKQNQSSAFLENKLSDFLNLETKILSKDKNKGEIRISFNSSEELESFLKRFGISDY